MALSAHHLNFLIAFCRLALMVSLVLAGVAQKHEVVLVEDGDLLDSHRFSQTHPVDWHAAVHAVDQSVQKHDVLDRGLLLVVGSEAQLVRKLHDLEGVLAHLVLSALLADALEAAVFTPDVVVLLQHVMKLLL